MYFLCSSGHSMKGSDFENTGLGVLDLGMNVLFFSWTFYTTLYSHPYCLDCKQSLDRLYRVLHHVTVISPGRGTRGLLLNFLWVVDKGKEASGLLLYPNTTSSSLNRTIYFPKDGVPLRKSACRVSVVDEDNKFLCLRSQKTTVQSLVTRDLKVSG